MLKRIKSILKSDKIVYDFNEILKKVKKIAIKERKVVICPDNTGANWLGIKNATFSMYPDITLSIPQFYSKQVLNDEELSELFKEFIDNGGVSVVLSGFPKYFEKLIFLGEKLNVKVSLIYHGGLSELTGNKKRQLEFGEINQHFRSHRLFKLAIVKSGIESAFTAYNEKSFSVYPLSTILDEKIKKKGSVELINIGVFGNSSFNKNRHTQVNAGLLIPNSIVHIVGENEFEYLDQSTRIKVYQQMNQLEFQQLLGKMDINLYCSYSESWGQVFVESLLYDVPCIVSMNSSLIDVYYENFPDLFVSQNDNPLFIASVIERILKKPPLNYSKIVHSIQDSINLNNQLFIKSC